MGLGLGLKEKDMDMAPLPTPMSTSTPTSNIPLIDYRPLLSLDPTSKLPTAHALLSAFKTSGFLYLTHHPISFSHLSTIFAQSASFFARPQAQKDALAWTTPTANRGYVTHGREKVSVLLGKEEVENERRGNPDLKETFEIGREGEEGNGSENENENENRWPDGMDREGRVFKEVMQEFFLELKEMHRVIMGALALGMGLEEGFFDGFVAKGDNTLRLLHYPPVKRKVFEENKGQVRAGAHTDYGSLTLLFQDDRGGLQVQGSEGKWLDVQPIEGACVVNAGDLLGRWSNDLVRSTLHRVVEPPLKERVKGVSEEEEDEYPARYSVAYFCNPDFGRWIEALPGTYGEEKGEKRYEGINSGEYLVQRLSATY